jgi:hypothetical protein
MWFKKVVFLFPETWELKSKYLLFFLILIFALFRQVISESSATTESLNSLPNLNKDINTGNIKIIIYLFLTLFLIAFCIVINEYYSNQNKISDSNYNQAYKLLEYHGQGNREEYMDNRNYTIRDI